MQQKKLIEEVRNKILLGTTEFTFCFAVEQNLNFESS